MGCKPEESEGSFLKPGKSKANTASEGAIDQNDLVTIVAASSSAGPSLNVNVNLGVVQDRHSQLPLQRIKTEEKQSR